MGKPEPVEIKWVVNKETGNIMFSEMGIGELSRLNKFLDELITWKCEQEPIVLYVKETQNDT